ncbi:CHAT domain-containing protein [Albirhodobacter sp. R86504]|uniref:CHAT domain-containing protein n=1 Tax=Albirhodobacter sp. R86504 TaxID=3093848 RepID=UPI00366E666C
MFQSDAVLYDPEAYLALLTSISARRNAGGLGAADLDAIEAEVCAFTGGAIGDPARAERELRELRRYLFSVAIDVGQVARAARFVEMARPPELRDPPRDDLPEASGDERVRWLMAQAWLHEAQGQFDATRDGFAVAGEEYARLPVPETGRFATLTNAVQSAYELGDYRRGARLLRRAEELGGAAASTEVQFNLALARLFPAVAEGDIAGFGAALAAAQAACLAHMPSQIDEINRFAALQYLKMGAPALAAAVLGDTPGANAPVVAQCADGQVRLQVQMAMGAPDPALVARMLMLQGTPESAPLDWSLSGVLAQALFAQHQTEAAVVMSTMFVRGIETVAATLPQRRSEAPELRARILAVFEPMVAALCAANYPHAAAELEALHQALLQGYALREGAYRDWAPGLQIAQAVTEATDLQARERQGAIERGAFAGHIMGFGQALQVAQEAAAFGVRAQTDAMGTTILRIGFLPVKGRLWRHVSSTRGERREALAMPVEEISAQMRALRRAFAREEEGHAPLAALAAGLFAGLEDELARATRVHIVPLGPVVTLPFGALLGAGQVLETGAVVTIGTGVAQPARPSAPPRADQVAIEIAYAQGGPQDPLNAPQAEARQIAALHGAPSATLSEFNRASLMRAVSSQPKILHIAAHFRMREGDLGRSSVIGAGGEEIPISAVFNAFVDLSATQLVFLAGCDSAGHGGAQSLAGQLNALGARHVIAALWPVDDAAASALAIATHEGLAQGLSSERALARAGQILRESKDFSSPRHWAAFQCYSA